MTNSTGTSDRLFAKLKRGQPVIEQPRLILKVGHGIEGDINAHAFSPRQILIVRQEDLSELSINAGELRENIAISGIDSNKFIPGAMIEFGGGAKIRLTFHCEPCKRIAHLVKSIKSIEGKRGILGVIVADGRIEVGDEFHLTNNAFPALSEIPYERFLDFISKIPSGKVVTYKQIIISIGVSDGYFRAIPRYIAKAHNSDYAIHRILDSTGNITAHIPNQLKKLEAEGIQVINETYICLQNYHWDDPTIYLD